ncbi:MAG: SMC-Scp complex subunit ScpB, partial [Candidatus Omnitrophica bacterium]|nr:SMC-Scp complex subunit ScpB [Candidatus Omnitrophota bacterium]
MIELELNKIIEALLFVSEKPLTIKQISEVCPKANPNDIKRALKDLMEQYAQPERGVQIIEVAGGYQFCSHPDCEPYLSKLYKTRKVFRLSGPALETLAIITYKQPVTKAEMEFIRGVNVDGVIKSLEDRELIKIKGRKEVAGRPILYGTTDKF